MASPRRTRLIRKTTMPGMPTRVNEALRKGVAGLKQLHDLIDFLGEMPEAVAHTAGAQTGSAVLLDTNATTCEFAPVMTLVWFALIIDHGVDRLSQEGQRQLSQRRFLRTYSRSTDKNLPVGDVAGDLGQHYVGSRNPRTGRG